MVCVTSIYTSGPLSAKVAFVGEAYGEMEEALGTPFHPKAPAGRELTHWLNVAGLSREEVYIDNAVTEHPPRNDMACFYTITTQGRLKKGPRWGDFLQYVGALKGRLEKCQANVIVALGGTALLALYGNLDADSSDSRPSVSKLRGSILESTLLPGRKLICTFHPSPRNWNAKKDQENASGITPEQRFFAMQDMMRIKGDSEFSEMRLPVRELVTLWDMDSVRSQIDLFPCSLVALDIETCNDEVSHISFSWDSRRAYVIPFWTPYNNVWSMAEEALLWGWIGKMVEEIPCVGHNIQFDAYYLWKKFGIRVNVAHDTMAGFHIAYPGLPKDLGTLVSLYTREPYYKDDGGDYKVNPENEEKFLRYSALDAAVLHDILPGVLRDLKAQGNLEVYENTIKLVEPVLFMQAKGIRLDMDRRSRLATYYRKLEEHITRYIERKVGLSLNPNSQRECVAYFHGEKAYLKTFGGWPKNEELAGKIKKLCAISEKFPPSTKDGKITADKKAMNKLSERGSQIASLFVKAKACGKFVSTFCEYPVLDGRSRSSINICGAVSGRFSAEGFKDVNKVIVEGTNHQNPPHAIKVCWLAD